ncbi:MAG: manganese efflux pump [Candidatus Delongbacteria bacterium]|nr:manganese efflux pump [Candidatus Delongbacteria bacterium]MBN2834064.1 manganese efflux pump [Candidatus Delongbacteria bacterium]
MRLFEITLIGIGLAMDAFAVSISSGVILKKMRIRHSLLIAGFFGFFQAIMPVIGWHTGIIFKSYIESFDHWIAFILLSYIGVKMIMDANKEDDDKNFDPLNLYILFTLAIATSVDALAVGVTFSVLGVEIWEASILIGLITFMICIVGTRIGCRFGNFLEKKIEWFGGIVLISIGIKILIEHLFFC